MTLVDDNATCCYLPDAIASCAIFSLSRMVVFRTLPGSEESVIS